MTFQIQIERVCSRCGSDTTQIKRTRKHKDGVLYEYPYWFLDDLGNWLCKKCKYKRDYTPVYGSKKIIFKGKTVYLDEVPRVGVCNWCRAVAPFDVIYTQMHHEHYHEDNPLKDAIEICLSCHKRHHNLIKKVQPI